jgi:hypothetical protein
MPLHTLKRWLPISLLAIGHGAFIARAVEPFAAYIFPAGGQRGTTVQARVAFTNRICV